MTTACTNPDQNLRCSKGRRCAHCLGLLNPGLTKQNCQSLVATLFGLVRRGKR